DPRGYLNLQRFHLEGTTPVWTFALADALIEKRIWMRHRSNTTFVRYDLARARRPLKLALKALVNYRGCHALTRVGPDHDPFRLDVGPIAHGLEVKAAGGQPFYLLSPEAKAEPAHEWYRNFDLEIERSRGLEDREDHLYAGTFTAELEPQGSLTMVLSTEPALDVTHELQSRWAREVVLLEQWAQAIPRVSGGKPEAEKAPAWVRHLVLAADQFIVRRSLPNDPEAHSVIAGYPWFGDWGRDTMIALPGLTLSTGQPATGRRILETFSKLVDEGMLPNRFTESGQTPEYNSVDSALWYVEAVRQYYAATHDRRRLGAWFPILVEIIERHLRGTRYGIYMDLGDGLLHAGAPGVQLTWMDAKVGDWVVTPRIGKPVEVNALWHNALAAMSEFASLVGAPATAFENLALQARAAFQRFWNPATGFCFDVIDGPEGNDATLRPNQLFAVSLEHSPLDAGQQRAVVDACAAQLLTSHGLRSLAPSDPAYQGHYGGPPRQRDAAYHQGTAWAWLLGPFVMAHLRVYRDPKQVATFLEPMAHHLKAYGLGSIAEIFDGDPPFVPRGAIAQAWSVAEVLRAWIACQEP
ncbi:MAG TPA: amylo-alpha-1,6-glucosidase, partial [Terriglobia bacterium]|nr:amylo-alpha-1,6-glucosidase [Terriglobia bacterium]